jgi:hypothetical protein
MNLNRIECRGTAAVAKKAIAALRLRRPLPGNIRRRMSQPDPHRDEAFQECDEAFYKLSEIPTKLFAYVRANPGGIYL